MRAPGDGRGGIGPRPGHLAAPASPRPGAAGLLAPLAVPRELRWPRRPPGGRRLRPHIPAVVERGLRRAPGRQRPGDGSEWRRARGDAPPSPARSGADRPPLTREREPRASAARGRCVCQGGLRRFRGQYRFGTRGMPRSARALSPDTAPAPAPGGGTRGRAADMRCSRPASFAVLAGGRYCRATPLRARSARRTRRRIFAANTSPGIRGEWWRPPRRPVRARAAVRCAACAAAAAGIRAPAPHSAAPGLRSCCGRTHPRASLHRPARPAGEVRGGGGAGRGGNRCGLKQAVLRNPARVWTRRQRTCDGVVPPFVRSRGRGGGRIRSAEPPASLAARRRRGEARTHAAPRYTAPA